MSDLPLLAVFLVAAYLVGSISSAIVVCRIMGLPDPRTVGSNNPGATNVLRIGGKKAAALTLVGDMLKGFLPVLIGLLIGLDMFDLALIGFAAFIGHLYPVFFGFRGGKGVATALGVFFGMNGLLGVAVAGTWLIIAKGFRISSLSALIATALAPLYAWLIGLSIKPIIVIAVLTALLWWRHRSNIRKLINKEEGAIGGPDQSSDD